jgi:phage-related tail fiber protein
VATKSYLIPINLNQQELQNAVIQKLGTDPGSPVDGQVWVNTVSNTLKIRLNGVTIALGRLDQLTNPTASLNLNSQKIVSLADGVSASDAATVGQLTALQTGMTWKSAVRAATATAGTLASSFANGSVIDGVTLVTGDRILLKNQASGSENGIYTVNASGAPTRATDADASNEVPPGMVVPIAEGTTNADTLWILTTNGPITLGTTALAFSKIPLGGGGQTKFTATGPASSTTTWTITHNLGTSDWTYMLRDATTNAEVIADVVATDNNTTTVTFGTAQSINSHKITISG